MSKELDFQEQQIVNDIDKTLLMEYNTMIAKEVRLSGSQEELRAFRYAKDTLESFGIQTELTFHDAYISLPREAKLRIGGQGIPCITHSMSPSTVEGDLKGRLVYIGEFTDDPNKKVKGKIAVIEGIALPSVVESLATAGAKAAIFISGPLTHEMIVSTVWGNPTPHTISLMPNIPVISINDDGGMLVHSLIQQHQIEAVIHTKVETKWTKIPTLTAEIKGNEESEQFVLFSGHIDSWYYGAMDNGSANATMLEVARVLSKYQNKLRRTLRIAFWSGHSHGRYAGSTAYCDKHWEEIHENCVMHFYIDSVGGKGATVLSESNCMTETKDIAAEFVNKISGQNYIGSRYGKSADQSFWGAGVPSLYMGMGEQPLTDDPKLRKVFALFGGEKSGGFGWWWHTVEDTIDKIDPDYLKRDCEIYTLSIYKVLTDSILPINHLAAVQELKDTVQHYSKKAGELIDLTITSSRLKGLEAILINIYAKMTSLETSNETLKNINRGLMELSRYLVPLNYVEGDNFDHDLAVGMEPLPLLAPISKLATIEKESHEYYLLQTSLNRKLNKVNYRLKKTLEVSERLLLSLEQNQTV